MKKKSSRPGRSSKADPAAQRRNQIARLANKFGSLADQIKKNFPDWDPEISPQNLADDRNGNELEVASRIEAARREEDRLHHSTILTLKNACSDITEALRTHEERHPNLDPVRRRRHQIARLASEFSSCAIELAKTLSDWDFEILPQVPTKDWSASDLERDAKLEAKRLHRNAVTEIAQACLKITDALHKHVDRYPAETNPIIEESAHWPAVISIHPALDTAKASAPIRKKLGSSLGLETKRLKKRTIWQRFVEFIIADIEKHLPDAKKFRAAGLPWLLDFIDSNGRLFQLSPDSWKTAEPLIGLWR
jgi:hypothetical protein